MLIKRIVFIQTIVSSMICMIAESCTTNSDCKNNGICINSTKCSCPCNFIGSQCEIESSGLCNENRKTNETSLFLITFDSGTNEFSCEKPEKFNFSTNYSQICPTKIIDGQFAFINTIPNTYGAWHAGELDHTENDTGGYMYLILLTPNATQIFNSTIDGLCIGKKYEFSAYMANIVKRGSSQAEPRISFEVRSATDYNHTIAQSNRELIPANDTLTWNKYSLLFNASTDSIILLMMSHIDTDVGNDIVMDDITLHVCSDEHCNFPIQETSIFCNSSNTSSQTTLLLITFGFGVREFSDKKPADFKFINNYEQKLLESIEHGHYGFVNAVPEKHVWHTKALDYTQDNNSHGYMFLVNLGRYNTTIFRSNTIQLIIGQRYEFSAYLANLVREPFNRSKPNIRFEVQSAVNGGYIIAQYDTNNLLEYNNMTWTKYGVSFNAFIDSVVLLMTSNVNGNEGNDLAIDNIELCICSAGNMNCYQTEVTTADVRSTIFSTSITSSSSDETTMVTTIPSIFDDSSFSSSSQSIIITTPTMPETSNRSILFFEPIQCKNSSVIGINCSVSKNPCDNLKPCRNNATCTNTHDGYKCLCLKGFNGSHCEYDFRICKQYACFNHGSCNKTFHCICNPGWHGLHCQTKINFCDHHMCQNNAICRSSLQNYTCQCLGDGYSGRYCEKIATKLIIYKIVSKSFAYVAIVAMISVGMFVVIMDILKYCFGIDPVEGERERLRKQKQAKTRKRNVIQRIVK